MGRGSDRSRRGDRLFADLSALRGARPLLLARDMATKNALGVLWVAMAMTGCSGKDGVSEPLRVEIDGPVGPAHTNAILTFQIDVHGPRPERVELRKDGGLLTELSYPYLWAWDTRTTPEGSHTVHAVAIDGDTVVESDPVQVFVDRTPPSIVERTPADGATDVDAFSHVTVELDEEIDERTLDDARVVFISGNPIFGASLGSDRRTLRLPAATDFLGFPNVATVDLSGVRDLAGNPIADATWSYRLPAWASVGSPATDGASSPAIAVDASGNPIVAFVTGGDLRVSRRVSGEWGALGGTLDADAGNEVASPVIAMADGNSPVVAWIERAADRDELRAARWNGTTWEPLGASPINATTGSDARDPVLARDAGGAPLLGWNEGGRVRIARWSAGAWTAVGAASLPAASSARGDWLCTEEGRTFVALVDGESALRVFELLSGSTWSQLGNGPVADVARDDLALTWNAWFFFPAVAFFEESTPGSHRLFVHQYAGGTEWFDLTGAPLTGAAGAANPRISNGPISQGGFFPGDPAAGGDTIPAAGQPSLQLAWEEAGEMRTMVFDAFTWLPHDDPAPATPVTRARPVLADDGVRGVWLAWEEAGAVQVGKINHR